MQARCVTVWEGGPRLPAWLLFKEKLNIQVFTLNPLALEYGLKNYYSTVLAKQICPRAGGGHEMLAVHQRVSRWPRLLLQVCQEGLA